MTAVLYCSQNSTWPIVSAVWYFNPLALLRSFGTGRCAAMGSAREEMSAAIAKRPNCIGPLDGSMPVACGHCQVYPTHHRNRGPLAFQFPAELKVPGRATPSHPLLPSFAAVRTPLPQRCDIFERSCAESGLIGEQPAYLSPEYMCSQWNRREFSERPERARRTIRRSFAVGEMRSF